jgi:hypothetical protein
MYSLLTQGQLSGKRHTISKASSKSLINLIAAVGLQSLMAI